MRYFLFSSLLINSVMTLFISALFISDSALSYTITTTRSGHQVRWAFGQKMLIAGNPKGNDHFSENAFWKSTLFGLQQWKWASQGLMDFEYWQGSNNNLYPPTLQQNGMSSIFFASNSRDGANTHSDPSIIGYTQVWYNENTGQLIESHIMLNDQNFELTTDSQDTSSHNSVGPDQRRKVFIGNILTHEIGHAIGLSHSGNLNSSMLYVEYLEQHRISCDDWAATRHLYLPQQSGTGAVSGTILSPHGEPLPGAQITIISQDRGTPLASTLSDEKGKFIFKAIEKGSFAFVVDAFQGAPNTVPSRMQTNANIATCNQFNHANHATFKPTFITHPDQHQLRVFSVQAGQTTQVGALQISCDGVQDSGDFYRNNYAPEMLVDQTDRARVYRYFSNGPFQITGLGYLVLSKYRVDMRATDEHGIEIPLSKSSPLYQSDSNFVIPDTVVSGNFYGDMYVEVTPHEIEDSAYPFPGIRPNFESYFVLNFKSHPRSSFASALPTNARCAPSDNFKNYTSPPGNPVRNSATQATRDGFGFCGNAHADPFRQIPHPAHPASIWAILEWFLPLWVAFASRRRYS